MDETEGIAVDLTWEGLFDVVQEQRHIMRQGNRVTLDAQRFAQLGSWSGQHRDRRRGDHRRPVGLDRQPRPVVGHPARSVRPNPPGGLPTRRSRACGGCTCRWRSTTSRSCIIIQEEPDGFRSLNDCTRIWKDGRVEQLGWPRVKIHYRSGTRIPTGATIDATDADGAPVRFDVESKLPVPIHVGGGYGGDSDWIHGVWKGEKFTERLTYDMTDPAIIGRAGFGVIDHVGRAVCHDGDGTSVRGLGPVRARRAGPPRPVGLRRLAHRRAVAELRRDGIYRTHSHVTREFHLDAVDLGQLVHDRGEASRAIGPG